MEVNYQLHADHCYANGKSPQLLCRGGKLGHTTNLNGVKMIQIDLSAGNLTPTPRLSNL
jgi:hypothetical protein